MSYSSERTIYFIKPVGMDGPIKIGSSFDPQKRLEIFNRWSPFPLEITATIAGSVYREVNIHECLAESHSHSEWFFPTYEVLRFVEQIRLGTPLEEAIDLSRRKRLILPYRLAATQRHLDKRRA